MYCINVKKFQNTPRGLDGRAAVTAIRTRLPDACFEVMSGDHVKVLHPTKGWRRRNFKRAMNHGEFQMLLDRLRQQAYHRMLIDRAEREKLKARRA
jgi:hypothetical protein